MQYTHSWDTLQRQQGIAYMHEAGKQKDLMEMVRSAFIDEAGAGLCKEFSQGG
jgi:hypothetical protein